MKVEILGSGCEKCKRLAANAQEAVAKLGLDCSLEKVTAIDRITAYGVMTTPALAVDGRVLSSGRVLSPEEIASLLKQDSLAVPAGTCSCNGCGTGEAPKAAEPCCCGAGKSGKRALTFILLVFVAASVVFVIAREMRNQGSAPAKAVPAAFPKDVLNVYYFHGTKRCMTCNKIEQLARTAIETKFSDALKSGRIVFQSVNLDEPANGHFVSDFQLSTRTVVMQRGDKFEKFDDVWSLAHDPDGFIAYLQAGAAKMMAGMK